VSPATVVDDSVTVFLHSNNKFDTRYSLCRPTHGWRLLKMFGRGKNEWPHNFSGLLFHNTVCIYNAAV